MQRCNERAEMDESTIGTDMLADLLEFHEDMISLNPAGQLAVVKERIENEPDDLPEIWSLRNVLGLFKMAVEMNG